MPSARTVRRCAAVAGFAMLMSACGSAGSSTGPTWRPKPSFQGEGIQPQNTPPAEQNRPSAPPSNTAPSSGGKPSGDPNVVAAHLASPTAVTILPDNTALVGERKSGRIVRVHPQPRQPVQVIRTLHGIDPKGGGGLLDLALSPNYDQDNLIFAYISTKRDNRVVAFTLHGPVTTVLKGIPRGARDNTGRLMFAPDGSLWVGTGDAGRPGAAANQHSLAGKVLRVTDIGRPAQGNPISGSPIYAKGFRETNGLCVDPTYRLTFQVEAVGAAAPDDPINIVEPGVDYGWRGRHATREPFATLPQTSRAPGGCAVLHHVLYTTSLDGQVLLAAALQTKAHKLTLSAFQPMLRNKYGRLRTVVAAPDGSLWITTANLDGQRRPQPKPSDDRVLRIVPNPDGGSSNKT